MTRYDLLLLLHLVAVIVWLGAGVTVDLLFLRAERTGDPRELANAGALQE